MRFFLAVLAISFVLSSCARIPYEQWSGQLEKNEATLKAQQLEAEVLAAPNERLYKGVIRATQDKKATPYARLASIVTAISSSKESILIETDSVLNTFTKFRTAHGSRPISGIGPDFSDYQLALSKAKSQAGLNQKNLQELVAHDLRFDSLCNAYKIQESALITQISELDKVISALKDRFSDASEEYHALKRNITNMPDAKDSMTKLNEIKQTVRQIESEFQEVSNLHGQLNSLAPGTIIYEGPYIKTNAEITLIKEKTNKINELLTKLEKQIKVYE